MKTNPKIKEEQPTIDVSHEEVKAEQLPYKLKIYDNINQITEHIGAISKNKENTQQKYKFRGIDDVYSALQPLLVLTRTVLNPHTTYHNVTQYTTNSGTIMFRVIVCMEYELISTEDGSSIVSAMYGEAMDSGDKATPKAMSSAFKYWAFQMFSIPTEEKIDTEYESPTIVETKVQTLQPIKPNPAVVPPPAKEALVSGTKRFDDAIAALKIKATTVDKIMLKYSLSPADESTLRDIQDNPTSL